MTTPQPAAQLVAVRAAQMALKTGMRVVGAVENMSYLVGTGQELFGSGGGQALADEIGVRRSSRGFRSTPCCAKPPTTATPCSRWRRTPRPHRRSSRLRSPSPRRGPGRSASRSRFSRSVSSDEARTRLEALGLDDDAVDALLAHFEDAERRGKAGHGFSRVEWLESLRLRPSCPTFAGRVARTDSSAGTEEARSAISSWRRSCGRPSRATRARAARRRRALLPERRARLLGPPARRGRARGRADGDVAPAASASRTEGPR